jgi:hypothetical protein
MLLPQLLAAPAWTSRQRCGRAPRRCVAPRAVAAPLPAESPLRLRRTGGAEPHGWSREDWAAGYATLREEFAYELEDIEGTLPPELQVRMTRPDAASAL